MIPRRLIRTVPKQTTAEVEGFWERACELHCGWEHLTLRDPIDRDLFPMTSRLWNSCESGAQMADLIRAEELYLQGGVYLDSDTEVYRSFEPLMGLRGFAGYDCCNDEFPMGCVPNAVMGFEPGHPALKCVIELAIERHHGGTWAAGVGVTTEVFPDRDDVALFPPGAFYPAFWRDRDTTDWSTVQARNPWAYCCHHAHHSWAQNRKAT